MAIQTKTLGSALSYVAALALLLLAAPVQAGIFPMQKRGDSFVPVESADISMVSETVIIEPSPGNELHLTANFRMHSSADTSLESWTGFPIVYARNRSESRSGGIYLEEKEGKGPWGYSMFFEDRRAQARQGKRLANGHSDDSFEYPYLARWKTQWAPLKTIIRFSRGIRSLETYRGLVKGWTSVYAARLGALWKGPIGHAEIRMRLNTDLPTGARCLSDLTGRRTPKSRLLVSYPEHAKWLSRTEVVWRFDNWEPREDVWVKSIEWVGFTPETVSQYVIELPDPYEGDIRQYTFEDLDALVKKEIEPWKRYFPKEVSALDRELLTRIVADWLYYEIFARRGSRRGSCGNAKVQYTGGWVSSAHGCPTVAWYQRFEDAYQQPWDRRSANSEPFRFEELTPLEQQNAIFLEGVLERLSSPTPTSIWEKPYFYAKLFQADRRRAMSSRHARETSIPMYGIKN